MKTLINLKADVTEKPWGAPVTKATVNVFTGTKKLYIRHLQITSDGVIVLKGKHKVGIPALELMKLVEQFEPNLCHPKEETKPEVKPNG